MVDGTAVFVEERAEQIADGASLAQAVEDFADDVGRGEQRARREVAAGDERDLALARPAHDFRQSVVGEQGRAALDGGAIDGRGDIIAFRADQPRELGRHLEGVGARAARHAAHQRGDPGAREATMLERARGGAQGAAPADAETQSVVDQGIQHDARGLADRVLQGVGIRKKGHDGDFVEREARLQLLLERDAMGERQLDLDADEPVLPGLTEDLVDLEPG
jgi:hypothetical protein